MKRIFQNMLPYWRSILVIVLFLAVQAFCDLSLPQYTSDIIDVGIQNSGIEHILPQEMTEEDYGLIQLFMTMEEKDDFTVCYEKKKDHYVCTADEHTLEELDDKLLLPVVMSYQVQNSMVDTTDISKTKQTDQADASGMDFSSMDKDTLIQMFSSGMITDDQLLQMRDELQDQVDTIGSQTLKSMGVAYAVICDKNASVDVDALQMKYMWNTGAKMLAVALLMALATVIVGYFASRVGAGIGRDLREKTFENVVRYSNSEMDRFSTASLITRSTNDVQQIQMVTAVFLRMVLYAPIIGIGGIIKVIQTGAGMGWVIGLAVLLILGLVSVLMIVAMPKFKVMQTLVDRLNLVSREILTGLNVIRAFGREKEEEKRFDKANQSLTKTQLFTNRVMTFMMPGMMMIMYCITLLIVWVASKRIDAGYMQVGAMTAFITYAMQIVMAFLMLTMMSIMMPRAGVAADRIHEVITTKTSIEEPKNPISAPKSGVLKFEHVNFKYPGAGEDVLSDINFAAEPGKTTAIIGSTGCGKSTLVNLIPRFYDVESGTITLDGEDIRSYSLKELREQIGFVPQKGILFSGTIASNLRFGDAQASDEKLRESAEIAQAMEFIGEKKEGFDSTIAQNGSNVSGGQKQRLSIARAIVRDPKIYVFDDSFSALDMKTDAKLRKALEEKTKDKTVLIVAQRISTILHADQILVLDDGKIVGKGTHEELLSSCEVYNQIARSQLSDKELGLTEEADGKEES